MANGVLGDYLDQLMRENPNGHVCYPKCLANGIGLQDRHQIWDWLHDRYAPKLDSPHVERIIEHLELTSEQSDKLRAALARRLAQPRKKRKRRGARRSELFASLLGPAVAEGLLTLLESAPDGTGRDEAANTITLTWRSRDALPMTSAQRERWRAALQAVLRRGWQMHYLVQLDQTGSRTVSLVQHMLDFIGMGAYVPRYFTTYPDTNSDTDIPASDLLVIPGVAAALVYSASTPHLADAGILIRERGQIDALAAHALQLEAATLPLLQTHAMPESPAEAVAAIQEAEDHSGGRMLFKNGLSVFTQPRWWFDEGSEPANPGVITNADEWRRCQLLQQQRIDTFERFVKFNHYFDICPLSALTSLTRDGVYPRDDIFVAPFQPRRRRVEHLRNTIEVLERNPLYHIGFVDENQAARIWRGPGQRLDTMWQVTGDGAVFLGTWGPDRTGALTPVNLHISEQTVAHGFREHFDRMWKKIPPRNREREHVIQRLWRAIKTIEEGGAEE